jgi:hypothetical protein
MANTLTSLTPTLFAAAAEVAAEATGVLDAIDLRINPNAAYGDSVTVPIAPVATSTTYTPAMTTTAGTDKIASSITISATANGISSFHLTGEDALSLSNGGPNDNKREWIKQLTAQAMRVLRNDAAAAALLAIKKGASRATGTAGTTPFATDLSALTAARRILRDNGAPMADLQCIVNSAAYVNLTNLGIIQQASMAGTEQERRSGIVGRQFGFKISEDANIATHTAGTPSGTLFSATEPVGETSLAYDTDTNGPWNVGDVVTFGSGGGSGTADANKYVVYADSTATPLYINQPGLRVQHVDNDTMTVVTDYTPNVAFERQAVVGFVRAPVIPANTNINQIQVSDPKSGLTFLVCEITGDGMITYRVHLMYGFKVIEPRFVATIIG